MKEYGNGDSWDVMFVIFNIPEFRAYDTMEPLFKTKEGEILVYTNTTYHRTVKAYSVDGNFRRDILASPENCHYFDHVLYEESLFSPTKNMYMCDGWLTCDINESVRFYDANAKFLKDVLVSTDKDFIKAISYEADRRDLDYEKRRQFYLSELGDSYEDGFRSRKKKSDKNMEKKHHQMKKKNQHSKKDHCWCTSIETSTRRKGWKGEKRNYKSKCRYYKENLQHDFSDICEGKAGKIERRRAPHIPYKTSVIAESYKTMRDSKFHIPENTCVSKQWQCIISNAITTRNDPKLFISSLSKDKFLSIHSLDQELRVESLCCPVKGHLLPVREFRAHSSFNGFLLIQINTELVMWNPLSNFFRKAFNSSFDGNNSSMVDLCFDHANNEYKMLLVDKIASYSFSAEIFYVASCGANSWEKVNVPDTVKRVYKGLSFNGYNHWISKGCFSPFRKSNPPSPRNHIVYFDPSTNEFIEIATPQPKKGDTDTIVGLGVLDGCLCMTRWDDPLSFQGNIEFLLMKEYKNGDSWNVVFIISNIPQFVAYDTMQPLFKTKEGELLVYTSIRDYQIVKAYDEYGNFRRDIQASLHSYSNLVLYEESWFFPTV